MKKEQELTCMNNRNKTQNLFYMKLLCNILFIILFLSSCSQSSNKEVSLNEKFIDIYKMDINMKLANIEELSDRNELKYKNSYTEILTIQSEFDSIYNLIEENNLNIKHLLKTISSLTAKNYRYKTANELELLSKIDTKDIGKNELQAVILELNSAILTDLSYNLDATDLRVNRISIVVVPEKKEIKIGESYEAKIIIAAVDTTNSPYIEYNNETIKMTGGVGYLQIKAEKKGKNKSTGLVYLPSTIQKNILVFPFNLEYEVK